MKLKYLFSVLSLFILMSFNTYSTPVDDVGDNIETFYKQMHSDFVADVTPVTQNNFTIQKDILVLSTIETSKVKVEIASNLKEKIKPDRISRSWINYENLTKRKNHFRRTDYNK